MKRDKLVRDKIPEIIEASGDRATIHTAAAAEYWSKLKEKLTEEVEEFLASEDPEELADVLEVIDAIVSYKNFTQIKTIKDRKASERGRFEKRIILEK